MTPRRPIVLLGLMTKMPVAGVVWQTIHYLLGLQRLGFDPYYVEAHAGTPSMLMRSPTDDATRLAAQFIAGVMRRFDLEHRWCYHALQDDGRCYGLSDRQLTEIYGSAELIINLHGGTVPREEHSRTGRLVYLETDPVQLQVELQAELPATIEFLEQHCAFFTFGENWGSPDCRLPPTQRFDFHSTRQPVCLDLWPVHSSTPLSCFTTIGNWRQGWRDVTLDGKVYSWSKGPEFEKILALPGRTGRRFELAVGSLEQADRRRLEDAGWQVGDVAPVSADVDRYRAYIGGSFAEFTVAKEQNVALRSGWFSDRSATYLASGRPVVTQETGFSNRLPTGEGLHGFTNLDDAAAAVEAVCSNYPDARRSARAIAREFFAAEVVLGKMLARVGIEVPPHRPVARALTREIELVPSSRRPLRLAPDSERHILHASIPFRAPHRRGSDASIVVVSWDNLAVTRLCVESVLENTHAPAHELIVVDNGSTDGSRTYLRTLARRFAHVSLVLNEGNLGFPRACNQGLALARGQILVLLNNDTVVAPDWLVRLQAHAREASVGLVGPATNRIGNEAEVAVGYSTYGGFLAEAAARAQEFDAQSFDIPMPAMFCLAFRRDVFERLGPLDEQFGVGTLEDDDYAERSRQAGYRSICAEDVLVHHFGEASFGRLFATGEHSALLASNRSRYERKWGKPWRPYERRQSARYEAVRERVRQLICAQTDEHDPVIVASRGDDELLRFNGREGWHFPQSRDGAYAGHYPSSSAEAIDELEELRSRGGAYFVLPTTSFWWLDHYQALQRHLSQHYREVVRDEACLIFELRGEGESAAR